MLAEGLAKNGISSLRFDKRGIGKSVYAAPKESDLRFETYVNDAVAWVRILKSSLQYSKIIVLGHSEGALIGNLVAEQIKINAFISIAGAGSSIDAILKKQLSSKLPPQLIVQSNRILDSLRIGKTVSEVNSPLLSLYRPSVQQYMITWMKYDPAKEISKLKIPVLLIQGSTDIQVSLDDVKLLYLSKKDAKLVIIENMNHILKDSDNDINRNIATYTDPVLPLKSGLVDLIVNFIHSL